MIEDQPHIEQNTIITVNISIYIFIYHHIVYVYHITVSCAQTV